MTPTSYRRILGANDRVTVGLIGLGGISRAHRRSLEAHPDRAAVAAVCDVHAERRAAAQEQFPEAVAVGDYRHILDRPDVDAVVVSTPDHWHALPTVHACAAGKDVYVEKPASRTIAEGRRMVEAARDYDRVVQVGTQQRSAPMYQQAVDLIQSGALGPITVVRTWNVYDQDVEGMGLPSDEAPPAELDWPMWLGPAPPVAYNPNRFGRFRQFWDYAGGLMTDWGTHHIDVVQWAMGVDYPQAVDALGGKFYVQDNRETPDTITATFQYPSFVMTYEARRLNDHPIHDKTYGIAFYGTAGTLAIDRRSFTVTPQPGSALEPMTVEGNGNAHEAHMLDFLDCVASRERPISDIEGGHRSSSTAMLGNVAYRTGRRIRWDGQRERAVGDATANALVDYHYHGPWAL